MLNVLRENFKKTPYLKWILGLVAVGLVLYLGDFFAGGSGSARQGQWAARVGGQEIPTRKFLETARRIDQRYRELFGSNYERIREQVQIPEQALQQLIDQEVILQDARRMGLRTSEEDLANEIRTDPGFHDASGRFVGAARYKELVERNVRGGIAAFESDLADELLAAKWTRMVTQSVAVADAELKELFRQRTETTAIDYVVVAGADQDVDQQVADGELQRWYDEHRASYRRGEGRKVRYVVIDRDEQMAQVEIGSEEIRAHYDGNPSSYGYPEQRRARHILFRAEPGGSETDKDEARGKAEEALARARAGEDFGELARDLSEDRGSAEQDGDLGFFGRGEMVGPFQEAAFATPVGELAPVVESPYGFHVVQVTGSRAAGVTPLEEVEDEIRRSLELAAAQDRGLSEAERIGGQIGGAAQLQEVADREGLVVASGTVTPEDRLPGLGVSADFLTALKTLEPGAVSPPLRVAAGMALVAVDEIVPPAVAPLEEVRSTVKSEILDDRSRRAALAAAEAALAEHDELAPAAAALGLEVQSSGDLTPGQSVASAGGSSPELEARLFGQSIAVGDRGAVAVPAGALIFEISAHQPFDRARFASEKAELRNEILGQRRLRYRQSLVNRLRERQEIVINQALMQQFRS